MDEISSSRPSSYQLLEQTGPDWFPSGVPDMSVQLIPVTPPVTYDTLLHDTESSSSSYFGYNQAYDSERIRKCGYSFVRRRCDGLLSTPVHVTSVPTNLGAANPPPEPTFIPKYRARFQ